MFFKNSFECYNQLSHIWCGFIKRTLINREREYEKVWNLSIDYLKCIFCLSCSEQVNNTEEENLEVYPSIAFTFNDFKKQDGYPKTCEIPNGIRIIASGAFKGCTELESVTIPDSVTMIFSEAFSGCSNLKSIDIPSSVCNIGKEAFRGCSSLETVTIPKMPSIAEGAFADCTSLTSVNISKYIHKIYANAFSGDINLTTINFGGSIVEWQKINKTISWKNQVPATRVRCTNGITSINR